MNTDFVQVQLSAAGLKFAGASGAVQISNGRFAYKFAAGKPVRVLTSEWARVLSKESVDGSAIFEVVPAAPPAPAVITAPAVPAKTVSDSQTSNGGK